MTSPGAEPPGAGGPSAPACVDGEVMEAAQARVPATDDGLLRGDGVFEVVRLYGGRPYALAEHLDRLARSAANLRLELDRAAIERDIGGLLAAAGPVDGLLRVLATRGGRRIVLVEPLPALPPRISLGRVTYAPTRVLDGIKSLSYAANMLATRLAQERGFDEALLTTPHGRVLEAPTSSFFWVAGGDVLTPPLSDHILASITRARVVELSGAREAPCTLEDVASADEAFLASTVRETVPVARVEGHELPHEAPVARRIGGDLRALIERELGG